MTDVLLWVLGGFIIGYLLGEMKYRNKYREVCHVLLAVMMAPDDYELRKVVEKDQDFE